jgi:hypothetical protein
LLEINPHLSSGKHSSDKAFFLASDSDRIPIRAIREIRGEKSCQQCFSLPDAGTISERSFFPFPCQSLFPDHEERRLDNTVGDPSSRRTECKWSFGFVPFVLFRGYSLRLAHRKVWFQYRKATVARMHGRPCKPAAISAIIAPVHS